MSLITPMQKMCDLSMMAVNATKDGRFVVPEIEKLVLKSKELGEYFKGLDIPKEISEEEARNLADSVLSMVKVLKQL